MGRTSKQGQQGAGPGAAGAVRAAGERRRLRAVRLYAADHGERDAADGASEPVAGRPGPGRGRPEPASGCEEFVAARRAEGRTSGLSLRSLAPVLAVLADAGVLAAGGAGGAGVGAGAAAGGLRASSAVRAGAGRLDARRLCRPGAPFPGRAGRQAGRADRRRRHRGGARGGREGVGGSAQYFVAALRAFLRFCFLDGRSRRTWPGPRRR